MIIEVDISDQSVDYLKRLAALGLYGRGISEVAARLIDDSLLKIDRKQAKHPEFLIQTRAKH